MAQRELLGHHAAHRDPHDVRGVPAEVVEQPRGVVGELGDGERVGLRRGVPDPAMVVGHHVEVVAEAGEERVAPGQVRPAHPLDEEHRLAGAAALVVQRDLVDGGLWHGAARY